MAGIAPAAPLGAQPGPQLGAPQPGMAAMPRAPTWLSSEGSGAAQPPAPALPAGAHGVASQQPLAAQPPAELADGQGQAAAAGRRQGRRRMLDSPEPEAAALPPPYPAPPSLTLGVTAQQQQQQHAAVHQPAQGRGLSRRSTPETSDFSSLGPAFGGSAQQQQQQQQQPGGAPYGASAYGVAADSAAHGGAAPRTLSGAASYDAGAGLGAGQPLLGGSLPDGGAAAPKGRRRDSSQSGLGGGIDDDIFGGAPKRLTAADPFAKVPAAQEQLAGKYPPARDPFASVPDPSNLFNSNRPAPVADPLAAAAPHGVSSFNSRHAPPAPSTTGAGSEGSGMGSVSTFGAEPSLGAKPAPASSFGGSSATGPGGRIAPTRGPNDFDLVADLSDEEIL
jgi:hypothetical protein